MNKKFILPKDGIQGLKENFTSDAISGFLVFLLALPLSLGIAKASDFPPIMGLMTAMIGGLVVSFFAGSKLTIKGPAAGLIVIVAGSVAEFGRGDSLLGWHLALGALLVAGLLQILFGMIRMGSLVDFFPLSAVHGMLAAIGIIIMSKQVHVLLGINPVDEMGKPIVEPMELLAEIPHTFSNINSNVAIIGLLSLAIVFLWPKIKHPTFKMIPAPVVVLAVSIPLAKYLGLGKGQLIHFDQDFIHTLAWNERFDGFQQTGVFIKYVLMFALVGSLESLLTVKAVDMLDPYRRKSNANKDLVAVGIGNVIASLLGGLPMISEVARSSANVSNGAKTRWANFFHGVFILIFLMLDLQFSDLIPFAALAAMLIGVGFKLASPREFGRMAKIGPEQLIVFCTTIAVTIMTDLLVGIGVGIIVKLITQFVLGVPLKSTFKAHVKETQGRIAVSGAAVFSNWLGIKKHVDAVKKTDHLLLDLSQCNVVDHTVMDNIIHLRNDFENGGGALEVVGLELLKPTSKSNHDLSTRMRDRENRLDHLGQLK
ncbi:MAG: SulP family inorganic anion transporter [Bacteroidetes bacterium]|jgi:MFS superfamily sulfate permease-like transporter|nr:SulP family inorganic anion transporter [Bacteroidota bacterium]